MTKEGTKQMRSLIALIAGAVLIVGLVAAFGESKTGPAEGNTVTDVDLGTLEGRPLLGNPNAPVTIVEYSDFECPFCEKAYSGAMKQINESYVKDGKVNVVFKHFPLGFHKKAEKAAEAAECAGDQGKFWEMHNMLFENQHSITVDDLKGYAGDIGLSQDKFDTCLDSGSKSSVIQAELADGKTAGVTGTPAFFINGIKLSGAQPFNRFADVIDAVLEGNTEKIEQIKKASAPQPAPPSGPVEVDAAGNAFLGDANAPVEVIEFSDYECPYCSRAWGDAVKGIRENYIDSGKVKFVYRDFPLGFHASAQKAAEAAECAGEQDKYWAMHDVIFAKRGLSVDKLKASAGEIGLDQTAFDTCLDSGAMADEVKADLEAGKKIGVQGTPTFFVNGIPVRGAQPFEALKKVIEAELAK